MLTVAMAVLSRPVLAQVCVGGIGLQSAPAQIGASLSIGSDTKVFSGDVTFGSANSVFGSLGAGYAIVDGANQFDDDPTGFTVGGLLGYAASLGSEGRAEFCPMAGASWVNVSADFLGESITLKQTAFQFGGSIGFALPSSTNVSVIPFVGLSYARFDGTVEGGGESLDLEADSYTPGTFGVGIVLSQFAIVGSVVVPFGLEGSDPSFTASMRFGLGRR